MYGQRPQEIDQVSDRATRREAGVRAKTPRNSEVFRHRPPMLGPSMFALAKTHSSFALVSLDANGNPRVLDARRFLLYKCCTSYLRLEPLANRRRNPGSSTFSICTVSSSPLGYAHALERISNVYSSVTGRSRRKSDFTSDPCMVEKNIPQVLLSRCGLSASAPMPPLGSCPGDAAPPPVYNCLRMPAE